MLEFEREDIHRILEMVARERIGALRIVWEGGELVVGVDAAALSELFGSTDRSEPESRIVQADEVADPERHGNAGAASETGALESSGDRNAPMANGGGRQTGVAITAPLLGVFYTAPELGAPPYVTLGEEVGEGTTVGLIEAMKVFTAVAAGRSGRISAICVQNEEFVEFGQTLMELEVP